MSSMLHRPLSKGGLLLLFLTIFVAARTITAAPLCSGITKKTRCRRRKTKCVWKKGNCKPRPKNKNPKPNPNHKCKDETKPTRCRKSGCKWNGTKKNGSCSSKNDEDTVQLHPRDENPDFWQALAGMTAPEAQTEIQDTFPDYFTVYTCPPTEDPPDPPTQCEWKNHDSYRVRLFLRTDGSVEEARKG